MENRRVRNRTGIFECGSELPTLSTRRMVHRNRTGARPRRSCCPLELLNHTSRQVNVKLFFQFLATFRDGRLVASSYDLPNALCLASVRVRCLTHQLRTSRVRLLLRVVIGDEVTRFPTLDVRVSHVGPASPSQERPEPLEEVSLA